MSQYIYFIKREVWEHRTAFFITPAVFIILSGLLLILAVAFGRTSNYIDMQFPGVNEQEYQFEYSSRVVGEVDDVKLLPGQLQDLHHSDELSQAVFIVQAIPYGLFWGLMMIIGVGYWLSCLSTDRKDGSILFWKSLPVSETQSVMSKLFTAALLLPAIAWIAGFIMSVVLFLVIWVVALFSPIEGAANLVWQHQTILSTGFAYVGSFIAGALWMLPIATWCMLASAAAKRIPFFMAVLPLVVLIIAEKILLGSTDLIENTVNSITGILPGSGTWLILSPGWDSITGVLVSFQFWCGLILSMSFMLAAIWMRENRFQPI